MAFNIKDAIGGIANSAFEHLVRAGFTVAKEHLKNKWGGESGSGSGQGSGVQMPQSMGGARGEDSTAAGGQAPSPGQTTGGSGGAGGNIEGIVNYYAAIVARAITSAIHQENQTRGGSGGVGGGVSQGGAAAGGGDSGQGGFGSTTGHLADILRRVIKGKPSAAGDAGGSPGEAGGSSGGNPIAGNQPSSQGGWVDSVKNHTVNVLRKVMGKESEERPAASEPDVSPGGSGSPSRAWAAESADSGAAAEAGAAGVRGLAGAAGATGAEELAGAAAGAVGGAAVAGAEGAAVAGTEVAATGAAVVGTTLAGPIGVALAAVFLATAASLKGLSKVAEYNAAAVANQQYLGAFGGSVQDSYIGLQAARYEQQVGLSTYLAPSIKNQTKAQAESEYESNRTGAYLGAFFNDFEATLTGWWAKVKRAFNWGIGAPELPKGGVGFVELPINRLVKDIADGKHGGPKTKLLPNQRRWR